MNKTILALPLVLVAFGCRDRYEGQAGAASNPAPAATPYGSETMASPGAVSGAAVTATVVSVDAVGRTVTLRETSATGAPTGDAAGRSYSVAPAASPSLGDLKAGDQVNVMCETGGATATGAAGSGSLADCTLITTIAPAGGATGQ